ncbi:MAG: universal stress protein [Nitrincola lacisaponensis]|nr:universal stress protein [Nitrincola lacisaponensis]
MSIKIILPLDLQDRDSAIAGLVRAKTYLGDRPVEMYFMSILPKPVPLLGAYLPKEEIASALRVLEDEMRLLVKQVMPEIGPFFTKATEGVIFKEILKYAREVQPDLIMLPSHSHSKVENILIGSVTSKVVERADCSVLVIR